MLRPLGKLDLLFRLAWRNVLRNRRRSAIILVAIVVGLWSMILFGSFVRAWANDVVRHAIITLTGHLQTHAPGYRDDPVVERAMALPSGDLLAVLAEPGVLAWARRVRVPAVVMSEREAAGVTLVGIDPEAERGLSFIPEAVTEGRYLAPEGERGILLGRELAERLDTAVGKRVVVMSQAADGSVADRGFRVVGLYDADREATEMTFVFVARERASALLGLGDRISEIAVMLHDRRALAGYLERLSVAAPGLDVAPWTTLEPLAQATAAMGEAWAWMFYIVMYLAMAFGLVNTLLMAVAERTRELGMLQALGMRPRLILGQVLLESSILLLVGTAAGGLLAAATLTLLSGGVDVGSLAEGAEVWGMGKVLYPTVTVADVASAYLVVGALGLLASLYPAWRAARRVPVEAITRGY